MLPQRLVMQVFCLPAQGMTEATENPDDQAGKEKKKAKVRNVWISFAGRIVAQIVGAVASVVLGIMVLQRYQDRPSGPASAPAPAASRLSPARSPGNPAVRPRPAGEGADPGE